MGLIGLRKFIDATGCTRLLPVPLSEEEARELEHRRLQFIAANGGESDDGDDGVGADGHNGASSSSSNGLDAEDANRVATADHVLVDMNCIVHSCFGRHDIETKSKKEIIQDILERLRLLLTRVVVPRRSLTICLDGPAPIAKLQTQRLRRHRVSLLDSGSAQQLNSLSITAGSLFLVELENALAAQFKLNRGKGFLLRYCPVYLYGSTVMGEGEAKVSQGLAFLATNGGHVSVQEEGNRGGGGDDATHGSSSGTSAYSTHSSSPPPGSSQWKRDRASRDGRFASTKNGRRVPDSFGKSSGNGNGNGNSSGTAMQSAPSSSTSRGLLAYNPNDTVVVIGNDIDLVITCLGATPYHNISVVGPSSLQLIDVSDVLYRWLKASAATQGESSRISPVQLPSVRIDFIFLFLLNGGDHYVGAGEVAMGLWRRYRTVRAAYPNSTLVSSTLDSIDVDFLADVLNTSEYSGDADVRVGVELLQSALWSLYTVVTGVCPDYKYIPKPEAPHLNHLRAAAAHYQRTHKAIQLHFVPHSHPLTPLETYVALMPSEATLPKSVATALQQPAHHALSQTLLESNDAAQIARAAVAAVDAATPFLTTSEQYLRQFTGPVQLNVLPPRRRLSRYEQHRMIAKHGAVFVEDPAPVVQRVTPPEAMDYVHLRYPESTAFLAFISPFAHSSEAEDGGGRQGAANSRGAVSSNSYSDGARTYGRPNGKGPRTAAKPSTVPEARKVSLKDENEVEAASTSAALQRALDETHALAERGWLAKKSKLRAAHKKLHKLKALTEKQLREEDAADAARYTVHAPGEAVKGRQLQGGKGSHKKPKDTQQQQQPTGKKGKHGVTHEAAAEAEFLNELQQFLGEDAEEGTEALFRSRHPQKTSKGGKKSKAATARSAAASAAEHSPPRKKQKVEGGVKGNGGGGLAKRNDGMARSPPPLSAPARANSSHDGHDKRRNKGKRVKRGRDE